MDCVTRIRHWLFDEAIPVWTEKCLDPHFGGPVESFDLTGTGPSADPFKRTFVVARQLYVMSHAACLGVDKAGPIADTLFDYLSKHNWQGADQGWVHSLAHDKTIFDPTADLYDFAFCLFGLGWYYKYSKSPAALKMAHQTTDIIENAFRHPSGKGFHNQIPATLPRQQNPHMHLFEAALAMWDATGDDRFGQLSNELADFFLQHLYTPEIGTVPEFFDDGLARLGDEDGNRLEAGHQFEWAWILAQHQKLSGQDHSGVVRTLVSNAETFGVDPISQLTINANHLDMIPKDKGSRTWPSTERIKGWLGLYELTGTAPWHAVESSCDALFSHHLGSLAPYGMWIDAFDAQRQPTSSKIPSSTLYHVWLAFTEVLRLAPEPTTPG